MIMSDPRIAMVGAGYWGKNILRNLDALNCLAAICDVNEDIRSQYRKIYPAADIYSDLDSVLNNRSIDGVVIATPASTHGELVQSALHAGKHVFVEKPLCLDVREADALVKYAAECDLTLMVGHLLLYHPAVLSLQKTLTSGQIGKLNYIYSNRLSLGKVRREENALWSFAPHDISMILSMIGNLPRIVSTSGGKFLQPNVADTTLSYFEFPDNVHAHVFVSWLHPYKEHKLVVCGEKGMIVLNDNADGLEKLQLFPHRLINCDGLPSFEKADGKPIEYAPDEPLRKEMEAFVLAITSGLKPPSDGAEGARVLHVLEACHRSFLERRPINL